MGYRASALRGVVACAFVALATAVVGCAGARENTQPRVTVHATPRAGVAPIEVALSADVTGGDGALTYVWDFGDGMSAMGAMVGTNATHSYAHGGTITATLTVTDGDGDVGVGSIDLAIGTAANPAAAITATPTTGSAPLAVDFSCAASGGNAPLTIAWDFGDGAGATGESASHTYVTRGTYTATCTVTDADGSSAADHQTITVALNTAPVAVASATYDGSDAPLDVMFHGDAVGGDGTLTYAWRFGDGMTSTETSPMHTYTAAGTYRAVLTVTDADGDFGVDTVEIQVTNPATRNHPPVVIAAITAGACTIPGSTMGGTPAVQLDAAGSTDPDGDALTYEWVFVRVPAGSTVAFANPDVQNPSFTADREGTYTLRVFVSDGVDRVASDELTVTSSGPSAVSIVSGNNQSTKAGTPFTAPLVVHVQNSCGAPVPNQVPGVSGVDAGGMPGAPTDAAGNVSISISAGTRAGAASLDASFTAFTVGHPPVVAHATLTVTAGDPTQITMDAAPITSFDAASGAALTFRVTDGFGNAVTTTNTSFTMCVSGPGAGPGTGFGAMLTPCVDLSTTAGVATATLHSGAAADVQLTFQTPMPPMFGFVSYADGAVETFETDGGFRPTGDNATLATEWARGTPTVVGPSACHAGTGCYGTVLNGNYTAGTGRADRASLEGTLDAWMADYRPSMMVVADYEWFDAPNTVLSNYACIGGEGGALNMQTQPPWAPPGSYDDMQPLDGGNVQPCFSRGPYRSGSSGGQWIAASWFMPFGPPMSGGGRVPVRWSLLRGGSTTVGAGWYIDDARIHATFNGVAWVHFVGACSNGIDDDGDGVVDYPYDPGCSSPNDGDETDPLTPPQCSNGMDDDGDRLTDYPDDPDCTSAGDDSEAQSCSNGTDDDNDGYVDMSDPECQGVIHPPPFDEAGQNIPWAGCANGTDDDGDGLVDGHDPDCTDWRNSEMPRFSTCMNGFDDDMDGWIDFEDPDCMGGPGANEMGFSPFSCNDGMDNNGNMLVDRRDPACFSATAFEM